MLSALIEGTTDTEILAELARGKLRKQLPQLQQALDGRVQAHHRLLLKHILAHISFLEETLEQLQQEIEQHLCPFEEAMTLRIGIPGIASLAAGTILAEIGGDMTRFPSAKHLSSWAGVVRCITRLSIPGTARKNSKGGSWVNGLPHVERLWGTVACH
jgi:transposase